MEHTEGKWKTEKGGHDILNETGGRIANIRLEANAHRIVACVNACDGIPTEALEGRDNFFSMAGNALKKLDHSEKVRERLAQLIRDNWNCGCKECQIAIEESINLAEEGSDT